MRTAIYNKVKRVAALAIVAALTVPAMQAQEALHLFYKNGNRETIVLTPDTKVEFYKKPYANIFYDTDTIHMSASSGRTVGLGHAEYNVDWDITTNDDWLLTRKGDSPSPMGDGMQNDYFVVYAKANATDQRREGKVTVTSPKAGLTCASSCLSALHCLPVFQFCKRFLCCDYHFMFKQCFKSEEDSDCYS